MKDHTRYMIKTFRKRRKNLGAKRGGDYQREIARRAWEYRKRLRAAQLESI